MTDAPRRLRWTRAVTAAAGLLAVAGLAFAVLNHASAQTIGGKRPVPEKKGDTEKKAEKPAPALISDILVPGVGGAEQVVAINEALEKAWRDNKLEPAERCSDYEFIRRASLDLIGRIAKVEEIEAFMKQPERERRSWLIEKLLDSDEYAENFANVWTTLLLTRGANEFARQQMHLWVFEQFQAKDTDWSKVATELVAASGKSDDKGQVNFVLAHMGEEIKEDRGENGRYEMVPVTSRTTKLFLGLRTQCTQCHDHPFNEEWRQSHFWGVNAFFRQVDTPSGRPQMMDNKKKGAAANRFEVTDNPDYNKKGLVPYERRNGVVLFTNATFLDGKKLPAEFSGSRRQALAEFITKSPYFSKAFVNRTWAHFFARGLTKDAIDDFGEHNQVVFPDLLNKLAEDWATKYKHNPRDLVRWICNSKAYGLSSVANRTNATPDAEPFFSRMLLKAMTPEQLFESLMVATQSKAAQANEDRKKLRKEWMEKLVLNFGDDEGNETTFNGTVIQALMLMNGQEINQAIMDKEYGTVANVLKQRGITPQAAMRSLYMAALNRPPTNAEYQRILSPRMITLPKLAPPRDAKQQAEFYAGFYQDLYWAILNSNEFFLNH
jgi:hypothetical protein